MTVEYLKQAIKTAATGEDETRRVVAEILAAIKSGGEGAAKEVGERLDSFSGDIIVGPEEIETAAQMVPDQLKEDLKFAYDRVCEFAEKQRESIKEFETELSPGLWAGQKLIPIEVFSLLYLMKKYSLNQIY